MARSTLFGEDGVEFFSGQTSAGGHGRGGCDFARMRQNPSLYKVNKSERNGIRYAWPFSSTWKKEMTPLACVGGAPPGVVCR